MDLATYVSYLTEAAPLMGSCFLICGALIVGLRWLIDFAKRATE